MSLDASPDATLGAADWYARRRNEARADAERLGARASTISLARVITFVSAVALGLGARFASLGRAGYLAALVLLVAFVVLLLIHDRILERQRRAEGSAAWAEEGIARLEDRYARDPKPGEHAVDDDHPYANDLDVTGRGGLLQSIDTTRTVGGRALLTQWLLAPASAAEVQLRQACAKDLAPRVELREALAVEGAIVAEEPPELAPLLRWAESGTGLRVTPLLRALALLFPAVTIGLLIFGGALSIPRASWLFTLVVQIVFAARYRTVVAPAILAASEHSAGLAQFARMFGVIERAKFAAPALEELRAGVAAGPASADIARLGRIVSFVEARRNEVFKLFIGPALLWDLNCAIALERWRERTGKHFEAHLRALHRFEALGALAARAYERPADAWPDVVDDEVTFHAKGLGHPLISFAKVVRNDVDLAGAGFVLLVTGSNMSGKSTLLRAMGTNVALALAGAPVRATSLRTTTFAVWTSMRVRDSLSEGVSHFLAELKRLKAVADAADAASNGRPVLFLLDEILHGTNSRERHLGARGIVRKLVTRRACGAISTHDLALGALEAELPGKVSNVHFREQVETVDGKETMTFDYQLRDGVVTSSNALRLMKIVGLDVELPD
jgi:hypothetical protein